MVSMSGLVSMVAILLLVLGYIDSNTLFYGSVAEGFNQQQLANAAVGIMFVLLFLIGRVKKGKSVFPGRTNNVVNLWEICALVLLFAGSLSINIVGSTRVSSAVFYIIFIALTLAKPNISYQVLQKLIDYSWILAIAIISSVLYYDGFAVSILRSFSHSVFSLPWNNPNKLTQLLICSIVLLSLRIFIRHKNLASRLLSITLIAGLVYVLLGTATRAGYVAIGAYAVLLLWHLFGKSFGRVLCAVFLTAIIVAVLLAGFQSAFFQELQEVDSFTSVLREYRMYPATRFTLWDKGIEKITSSAKIFLLGEGAGNTGVSTREIFPGRYQGDVAGLHNSFLDLVLQFGVLFTGFFFYLCAKILLARSGYKNKNILVLIISFATVMIGAFFETNFFMQYGYFPTIVRLLLIGSILYLKNGGELVQNQAEIRS